MEYTVDRVRERERGRGVHVSEGLVDNHCGLYITESLTMSLSLSLSVSLSLSLSVSVSVSMYFQLEYMSMCTFDYFNQIYLIVVNDPVDMFKPWNYPRPPAPPPPLPTHPAEDLN